MTDNKRFSVIVPVYNGEKYLKGCLESILCQDSFGDDCEIILVDDGSADGTRDICDDFCETHDCIRVIHKTKNEGLVAARRTGIEVTEGDYVLFVDADDHVLPGWLEKIRSAAEKEPDLILFNSEAVYTDRKLPYAHYIHPGLYTKEMLAEKIYPYLLVNKAHGYMFNATVRPTAWSKCFRKSLLKEHFVRDESISMMEDFCLTSECVLYADSIQVIPDCLYSYNKTNDGAMGATLFMNPIMFYVKALEYCRERLCGYSSDIDRQLDILAVMFAIIYIRRECSENGLYPIALLKCRTSIGKSGILKYIRTDDSLPPQVMRIAKLLKGRRYDVLIRKRAWNWAYER